jgi:WD40 repeat protein
MDQISRIAHPSQINKKKDNQMAAIFCTVLSPDETLMIQSVFVGTLVIVDIRTHKRHVWDQFVNNIRHLSFHNDGETVLALSFANYIEFLDIRQQKRLSVISPISPFVTLHVNFTIGKNCLVASFDDKDFIVYDYKKRTRVATLCRHTSTVHFVCDTTRGIFSASKDKSIIQWESYQPRKIFIGHTSDVIHLAYKENILCSASFDKTVRVWDIDSTECLHVLPIYASCIAIQSRWLVCGGNFGTITIWDHQRGKLLQNTNIHENRTVTSICITSQGWVYSSSFNGKIGICKLPCTSLDESLRIILPEHCFSEAL